MAYLTKWNPFHDLEKLRADFDQVIDRFRSPSWLT